MGILFLSTKFEFDWMAEWLRRMLLDKKVQSSISGSNLLCSCHIGGSNSHIQAHGVYFHRFPSYLSDETLNRGPESISYLYQLVK